MREPDGHEYSVKVRMEVTRCIYCNQVIELRPRDIVDIRPPVRDDDA